MQLTFTSIEPVPRLFPLPMGSFPEYIHLINGNVNNISFSKEGKLVNTIKSTKTRAKIVQKYE
jgi:hypothetical protein